ncbi:DUF3501 family protein [Myxococcota bacterium]|nr:DUF3501 family protein [Myxococcota bacterium]
MRRVQRADILDYVTYEERRASIRAEAMAEKDLRRVIVGDVITLLFENTITVRYQVQEMVRVERIVREADIQHEIATYNELLGGPGELGASMLIGIDDPAERDVKLRQWLGVPQKMFVRLEDGTKVFARVDDRQVGEERVSSVQYLKFDTKGRVPVAVGCDDPALPIEALLTTETRRALDKDLRTDA